MKIQSIDNVDIFNKKSNESIAHWDESSFPPRITEKERELQREKFYEFCNTKFHSDEELDLTDKIFIIETDKNDKPIKIVFNTDYFPNVRGEDLSDMQE